MTFLLFCATTLFLAKRLLRYLRYLQQEEYAPSRFLGWVWSHRAFDRRGTLAILVCSLGYYYAPLGGALLLLAFAWWEGDPRKEGKLPLNMTARATRIYYLGWGITLALQCLLFLLSSPFLWIALVLLVQATPLVLAAATLCLAPDEARRQKKLMREARERWTAVSPYAIGITGSYGKTSTKHILGELLQTTLGATFWPDKGINTPMGITREIRSRLQKHTPYAVIEMGAYGPGSIKRLCDLTPPHAGIITGIGIAHLDRFGSEDIIRKTKGELAQAIPHNGILVCNGDNGGTRRLAQENPKKQTLLYGFDKTKGPLDCWIENYTATLEGARFVLHWEGERYEVKTPLLGKSAISNIAAAFTMACALGAQPALVVGAIAHLRPVKNRLELSKDEEITYLHDAYNSNPEGFTSALETLAILPATKRILMTPGMIELAGKRQEEHHRIGQKAAAVCDLAIIVGETNRQALMGGLKEGGMIPEKILLTATREEAFACLRAHASKGDAVLIENDLPDLYEAQERF